MSHAEGASETERLREEIKQLRRKNKCLQKMLLEENKLLTLQRFSFENLCENKELFRSATGINPDCFMRLTIFTQETTLVILNSMTLPNVCQRKSTQIQRKLALAQNRKYLQNSNYLCI